ncbi:CoA-transferase [uncultured Cohaesibacter sp.]
MQSKIIELEKVSDYFHDGMSIMFGGFMGVGTPPLLEPGSGKNLI